MLTTSILAAQSLWQTQVTPPEENYRMTTGSCDPSCTHYILGSQNFPTYGMLLAGETTSSQHGKTLRTQKKSWYHKEDISATSPKHLLPCSCCRDWSEGSDMSQCEAVLKDSPCACSPQFLKQTAALQIQTRMTSISWCSERHRAVLWPLELSATWQRSMSALSKMVNTSHMWLRSTWNMASSTEAWIFDFVILIKFKCKQPHVVSGYHIGQCRSRESNQECWGHRHWVCQRPMKNYILYAQSDCRYAGTTAHSFI